MNVTCLFPEYCNSTKSQVQENMAMKKPSTKKRFFAYQQHKELDSSWSGSHKLMAGSVENLHWKDILFCIDKHL